MCRMNFHSPAKGSIIYTRMNVYLRVAFAWVPLFFILAGGLGAAAPPGLPPVSVLPPSTDLGHPIPEFSLPAPSGEMLAISKFRGRPIVINFFASWCPSCWAEIPHLVKASTENRKQGLVVLGIGVLDDAGAQKWMIGRLGITYPTVYDVSGEVVTKVLRLRRMPTTIFIDRRGIVRAKWEGILDEATLRREIAKILS